MSNVLTSFLVGIGWDVTEFDKGTRNIERSLSGVKVSTLAASAAILGVFGAVAGAAISTAHQVDQLALATQNFNTGKQFVSNLGGALKLMGGDAAAALKEVTSIESVLSHLTVGDIGPLQELATAGVDISKLKDAKTAEGFLSLLADQVPTMTNPQKQLTQQSLGLSDATMKAMSGGGQQFEALLQRSEDLTGTIGHLTENSRILSDQMAEFGLRMTGITNELTEKTLPSLIDFSKWTNKFVEEHRQDISGAMDTIGEHPAATAALGGGAISTIIGGLMSKLGLKTLGGATSKAGVAGQIVGGATIATDVVFDTLENHFPALKETEQRVDQGARNMGLGKLVDFSDWLFNTDKTDIPLTPSDTTTPNRDSRYTPIPGVTDPSSYTPEAMPTPYKDVTPRSQEDNDTLVKAIQAAKVNVSNNVNLNVSLDGHALESKITEVQERANYSTIDDVRSSTSR